MPLNVASVLGRRAEGVPEVHVTAAAEEVLADALPAEGITCGEESALVVLARIDARALVTRAEPGEAARCRP